MNEVNAKLEALANYLIKAKVDNWTLNIPYLMNEYKLNEFQVRRSIELYYYPGNSNVYKG